MTGTQVLVAILSVAVIIGLVVFFSVLRRTKVTATVKTSYGEFGLTAVDPAAGAREVRISHSSTRDGNIVAENAGGGMRDCL